MSWAEVERPGEWAANGACRGSPTAWWFPAEVKQPTREEMEARRICSRCPVVSECLEFGISNREKHGIWGGKDVEERERIRNRRRKTVVQQIEVLPWLDTFPLTLEQQACQEAFK